jgi:hypothetical protein
MTILARVASKVRAGTTGRTSDLARDISEGIAVNFGEVVPAWREYVTRKGREDRRGNDGPDLTVLESPVELVLVDVDSSRGASDLDCSI